MSLVPFVEDSDLRLYHGDALTVLRQLPAESVDCVVTSPPYLDARPEYGGPADHEYALLFNLLAEVVRGGMLWNVGRIWRDGVEQLWWTDLIRSASFSGWQHWDTLVWVKPNANPIHGSVFANSHEYVLAFGRDGVRFNIDSARRPHSPSTVARFGRAWTNHRGVKQPRESRARKTRAEPNPLGALPRSYVEICVGREKGNPHPAPMAGDLAEYLVALGSWPGQMVLDPFAGSGTTALAARKLNRQAVLIEKSEDYCEMAARRLSQLSLLAEAAS